MGPGSDQHKLVCKETVLKIQKSTPVLFRHGWNFGNWLVEFNKNGMGSYHATRHTIGAHWTYQQYQHYQANCEVGGALSISINSTRAEEPRGRGS